MPHEPLLSYGSSPAPPSVSSPPRRGSLFPVPPPLGAPAVSSTAAAAVPGGSETALGRSPSGCPSEDRWPGPASGTPDPTPATVLDAAPLRRLVALPAAAATVSCCCDCCSSPAFATVPPEGEAPGTTIPVRLVFPRGDGCSGGDPPLLLLLPGCALRCCCCRVCFCPGGKAPLLLLLPGCSLCSCSL